MTDPQPPRPGYQQQAPQPANQQPANQQPAYQQPAQQPGYQYQNPPGAQQTSHPSAYAQPATTAAGGLRKNPLGLVSLIVGALIPLLGLLSTVVINFMIVGGNGTQGVGFAGAGFGVLSGVLGLTALALGIIALLRKNSRQAAAGAGTALGAAALLGVLGSLLTPLIFSLS